MEWFIQLQFLLRKASWEILFCVHRSFITDTFENVYCNIRSVKSNYLKCIVQFSYVEVSASFFYVEVIAIPATCLVNDVRTLGTIRAIVVWKERFVTLLACHGYF